MKRNLYGSGSFSFLLLLLIHLSQEGKISDMSDMNVEDPVMLGALTMTLINKNDPAYFRHVDGVFTAKHWTAIFIKELDVPRKVPDDVPIEKWGETYRMLIQEKLLQYPMLARICDLYEDYHYNPVEVKLLLTECKNIREKAADPDAIKGLGMIILGCSEALKEEVGLTFFCD